MKAELLMLTRFLKIMLVVNIHVRSETAIKRREGNYGREGVPETEETNLFL